MFHGLMDLLFSGKYIRPWTQKTMIGQILIIHIFF